MIKGLSNVSIALGSDIMRERDAQMGDDIELKTINVCEINFFNTYSLDDGIIPKMRYICMDHFGDNYPPESILTELVEPTQVNFIESK